MHKKQEVVGDIATNNNPPSSPNHAEFSAKSFKSPAHFIFAFIPQHRLKTSMRTSICAHTHPREDSISGNSDTNPAAQKIPIAEQLELFFTHLLRNISDLRPACKQVGPRGIL